MASSLERGSVLLGSFIMEGDMSGGEVATESTEMAPSVVIGPLPTEPKWNGHLSRIYGASDSFHYIEHFHMVAMESIIMFQIYFHSISEFLMDSNSLTHLDVNDTTTLSWSSVLTLTFEGLDL